MEIKEVSTLNHDVPILKYKAKYCIEDGYSFFKLIDAISKMISEVKFKIEDGQISITYMDPSRISLGKVEFNETYENRITIEENGDYGINLEDFSKVLKVFKNDKKTFKLKFNEKKLILEKLKQNGFKTTKTLNTLDLDIEEIPMDNLMKIDYPSKVEIQKEYLDDMFKESGLYSEVLEIKITEKGIIFAEEGQIGDGSYEIKEEFLNDLKYSETNDIGAYSLTFLIAIKHLLAVMSKEQLVTIELKTDHPLKIATEFEELGIIFTLFIAPRVSEEEFDEEDDFEF